jgi:hypothetical protein
VLLGNTRPYTQHQSPLGGQRFSFFRGVRTKRQPIGPSARYFTRPTSGRPLCYPFVLSLSSRNPYRTSTAITQAYDLSPCYRQGLRLSLRFVGWVVVRARDALCVAASCRPCLPAKSDGRNVSSSASSNACCDGSAQGGQRGCAATAAAIQFQKQSKRR